MYDSHATYTPGQSENRNGAISYPAFDRIGNLWTQDASGQRQLCYEDTTGFGSLTAGGGGNASPFKFGGANGCQSDADTGLVLMGYRYFDPRLGRFITQDPAGDGDNWYAYADNNPVNEVDPSGLMSAPVPGVWSMNGGTSGDAASAWGGFAYGNAAGGTPVYDAIFTENKSTHQIVGVAITGVAFYIGGGGGMGGVFMAAKGHVGHSDSSDEMKATIKQLNDEMNGGGKTTQERADLDKQINELKRKINTNQKASGNRKNRTQKIVDNPSASIRFNPAWTPPKVSPTVTTIGTIVFLVILKIITGPLPIP